MGKVFHKIFYNFLYLQYNKNKKKPLERLVPGEEFDNEKMRLSVIGKLYDCLHDGQCT